ncbi:MAG: prolyl oligopeptidase family serine peptidase [Flavobacteriaceae bacterium]|nr:prolyl oligopeptidase family serine peptidase [Flavobacteriaceae bacterium]
MKKSIFTTLSIFIFAHAFAQQKWNYPPTPKIPVYDTIWGKVIQDDYRWMEDLRDPKVKDWFEAQNNFAEHYLNLLNGMDELIAEWKLFDKLLPDAYTYLSHWIGDKIFYSKFSPGEVLPKLYVFNRKITKETLLFDPANFEGKRVNLMFFSPSDNGKFAAVGIAEGGSEITTIKILDVEKNNFLRNEIFPTAGFPQGVSWTADNKGFFYVKLSGTDTKDPNLLLNTKAMFHRIGTDPKNDVDYFSNSSFPDLDVKPLEFPSVYTVKNSPDYYLTERGITGGNRHFYIGNKKNGQFSKELKVLIRPENNVRAAPIIIGNNIYIITYDNAPNFKLVRMNAKNPDWSKAETIVPEMKDKVLRTALYTRNHLLLSYFDGINSTLYRYHLKNKKLEPIDLPYSGQVSATVMDIEKEVVAVKINSWIKPSEEFYLNLSTAQFGNSAFNKPMEMPYKYRDLVVEELEVASHDGTMVPLSIFYKKGLRKDRQNYVLMIGYGAYGIPLTPRFFNYAVSLASRENVIVAVAHVRGGGEKGAAWRMGGYKQTKPNTWKDFIACAEYFVKENYTIPARIAAHAESAGGILISRSITERPDLFGAVINQVGVSNILRAEFSHAGQSNIGEFGTIKNEKEFYALLEMDGVQHVKKGVNYPAVLATSGFNDLRVAPWQNGKFISALQSASPNNPKPFLFYTNFSAGHAVTDLDMLYGTLAKQIAFAFWQTGHPDFQPKK